MRARRSDFGRCPGLTAKAFAARLCGGDAGADAVLDQLPFELGDAGEDGRHHAAVRCRQVESQAVHGDDRYTPLVSGALLSACAGDRGCCGPSGTALVTSTASISRRCASASSPSCARRDRGFAPEAVSLNTPTTSGGRHAPRRRSGRVPAGRMRLIGGGDLGNKEPLAVPIELSPVWRRAIP